LIQGEDRLLLVLEGGDVTWVKHPEDALAHLKEESFSIVFCETVEVLKEARRADPQTFVTVLSREPSVTGAVEAMRLGAFDYLAPPFFPTVLEEVLERIDEADVIRRQTPPPPRGKIEQVIAGSSVMKAVVRDILAVAKSTASVFISGESGTGKEVVAHMIHFHSPRASAPFIKVNCAAVPETLIESEFFGHEKGAFTGALEKRLGRFELAHKGTLLLDEISEIPLGVQAKLLRVIQEQEFERVGGSKPLHVDVRLVATSNRNMREAIHEKMFREDLYYRLNVVPIHLPPLRERTEDILSLAEDFLDRLCLENHKKRRFLSKGAKEVLLAYPWPGNIRELANVIERTVVMDVGEIIEPWHLKLEVSPADKRLSLRDAQKSHIEQMLSLNAGDASRTASALGISLKTLRRRLRLLDIPRPQRSGSLPFLS
jgi:two-component system response regulator AtoC